MSKSSTTRWGDTILHRRIRCKGNADRVDITAISDINLLNKDAVAVIHEAAFCGNQRLFTMLLTYGAQDIELAGVKASEILEFCITHHDEISTLKMGVFKVLYSNCIKPYSNHDILKHSFIGVLLCGLVRECIADPSTSALSSIERYLGDTCAQRAMSEQLFEFSITSYAAADFMPLMSPLALYLRWIPEYAKEFTGAYLHDLKSLGVLETPTYIAVSVPSLPLDTSSTLTGSCGAAAAESDI